MIIKALFPTLENALSLKQANSSLVVDLLFSLPYGMWQSVSWLLITSIQEDWVLKNCLSRILMVIKITDVL